MLRLGKVRWAKEGRVLMWRGRYGSARLVKARQGMVGCVSAWWTWVCYVGFWRGVAGKVRHGVDGWG